MITRPRRRYKNRAAFRVMTPAPGAENRLTRRTPIVPESVDGTTNTVTITFPMPVILDGIPQYSGTVGGSPETPTAAALTSPTTLELTYSGTVTDPIVIPFEDPHVRNLAAGYVQPGSYSFPD